MSQRRIRGRLIIVACLAVGILAVAAFREREPLYHGRTLREWVDFAGAASGDPPENHMNDPKWQVAADAVQHIGTNALPFFLKWGLTEDSKTKIAVISWLDAHPSIHIHIKYAWDRQLEAYYGFLLLGEKGRAARLMFIQWTNDKDPRRRIAGLEGLSILDPEEETVLPAILRLIKDPIPKIAIQASYLCATRYPQHAESAGAYKWFPNLRPAQTNQSNTDQSVTNK